MKRHCDICNEIYDAKNAQSMFCSTECKRLGRNRRLRRKTEEKRKEIKEIECGYCSKLFKPVRIGNIYCSKQCKCRKFHEKCKNNGTTTKKKLKILVTDSRIAQGKCAECDETDIRLFEFAHFKREDKTIRSVSQHQCLSRVKEEFKKGRWLCVWCHRKETIEENKILFPNRMSSIRQKSLLYINGIKLKIGSCKICNLNITEETASFFEFDHIDPSTKLSTVADLVGCSRKRIDTEISKCRLLCCKCHRLHTIKQAIEKYNPPSKK